VDPAIALTLRGLLGLLLVVAAAHKLADPRRFAAVVAAYRVVPAAVARVAAAAIPLVELACAALLVPGGPAGPVLTAALLGAYAAAIGVNLRRGRRDLDCGCTGPGRRQPIGTWMVARNAVLVLAALALLVPPSSRALVWVDAITVGAAMLALAAVYAAAERLGANAPAIARLRGAA